MGYYLTALQSSRVQNTKIGLFQQKLINSRMKNITIKSLRAKQKSVSTAAESFFQSRNKIKDTKQESHKPKLAKKTASFVFLFVFVLTIGGIGGIIIDRFILPQLLVKYPQLNKYEFLKRMTEQTIIVETVKEIRISEDEAVVEAIEKVMPVLAEISGPFEKTEEFSFRGTGIIATSDGLILTLLDNIASDDSSAEMEKNLDKKAGTRNDKMLKVKLKNGKIYTAKILKKDPATGLVLLKIDEVNLSVAAFASPDDLKLGEKIIIASDGVKMDIISKFINDYSVLQETAKSAENKTEQMLQKRIQTMFKSDSLSKGAPAFNLKGEIIGVSQGADLLIPVDYIKNFINKLT